MLHEQVDHMSVAFIPDTPHSLFNWLLWPLGVLPVTMRWGKKKLILDMIL